MDPNQVIVVGLVPDQRLASLHTDADGNWKDVPEGQTAVPLVKLAKPTYDASEETVEPTLVWSADKVERAWTVRPLTEAEAILANRKIWPTSARYLVEFTLAEMAAISLSTDPTIAALRLLLASWDGEVWSDDPRVVAGLDAVEAAGIINAARKAEILAK